MLITQTNWLKMPARELGSSFNAPNTAHGVGTTLLKRHKILPHPREERVPDLYPQTPAAKPRDLVIDTGTLSIPSPDASSPRTLKHASKRIGAPGLPPTPPTHSRQSFGNQPSISSAPRFDVASIRTSTDAPSAPSTPPNQRSPPTPDVTPPRIMPPLAFRPHGSDRYPSSRTDSFKTAQENLDSSDEDEVSTVRPNLASARQSETEVPQVPTKLQRRKEVGLGLGLESDNEGRTTPKQGRGSQKEFVVFDGEWEASGSEISEVEREWDDNLMRNVTVRKRQRKLHLFTNGVADEVIEDDVVSPTNATRVVRGLPLQKRLVRHRLKRNAPDQTSSDKFFERIEWPTAAPNPESPSTTLDLRRFSAMSGRSLTSAVIEAMVVDGPPTRRKTLRHTKKQIGLRDFSSDQSTNSGPTSIISNEPHQQPLNSRGRLTEKGHRSLVSNGTTSNFRSRREILNSGGIPVVVIPDRLSSTRSSKAPSLRSTSSRRTKRSNSLSSAPISQSSKFNEPGYFDTLPSRKRTMSESGASNHSIRTIDFPPNIPTRRSSLSAPTSRNGSRASSLAPASRDTSRAGSLTTESLKAHNKFQARKPVPEPQPAITQPLGGLQKHLSNGNTQPIVEHNPGPFLGHQSQPSGESLHHKEWSNRSTLPNVDHNGDPFFGNRLSTQVTPFSQVSYETVGTAAEVSEAMAVTIFPHQNRSVLVVQHQPPSEPSPPTLQPIDTLQLPAAMAANGQGPFTPPQPIHPMDKVDSPLRNPREPPQPPAIKFIPPTPAGLTPGEEEERQLGYDPNEQRPSTSESKAKRSFSLVRQAFGNRRNSEPLQPGIGFLKRTFSLSNRHRESQIDGATQTSKANANPSTIYPSVTDRPADGSKLHPFWRPTHFWDDLEDDEDSEDEGFGGRYPIIDNRPAPPKRSLSGRLKRTFAILPIKDDYDYDYQQHYTTARRTVHRSVSGNMRVVKQRSGSTSRLDAAGERHVYTETRPRSDLGSGEIPFGYDFKEGNGGKRGYSIPGLGLRVEYVGWGGMKRRISEKRREQRSQKLRATISGPRIFQSGIDDVLRRRSQA